MDKGSKQLGIALIVIVSMFVLAIGSALGVVYVKYRREQAIIEQHQRAQMTIREMIKFCDFSKLDDAEMAKVTSCGDDVEAARFQLRLIIDDRISFWANRIRLCSNEIDRLNNIKNTNPSVWSDELQRVYDEKMNFARTEGREAISSHKAWTDKKKALETWSLNQTFDRTKLL